MKPNNPSLAVSKEQAIEAFKAATASVALFDKAGDSPYLSILEKGPLNHTVGLPVIQPSAGSYEYQPKSKIIRFHLDYTDPEIFAEDALKAANALDFLSSIESHRFARGALFSSGGRKAVATKAGMFSTVGNYVDVKSTDMLRKSHFTMIGEVMSDEKKFVDGLVFIGSGEVLRRLGEVDGFRFMTDLEPMRAVFTCTGYKFIEPQIFVKEQGVCIPNKAWEDAPYEVGFACGASSFEFMTPKGFKNGWEATLIASDKGAVAVARSFVAMRPLNPGAVIPIFYKR